MEENKIITEEKKLYESLIIKESESIEYELKAYKAYLSVITTFHKSYSGVDWRVLYHVSKPVEPVKTNYFERLHRKKIEEFKPRLIDKVFKHDEIKLNELKDTMHDMIDKDDQTYYDAVEQYSQELEDFKEYKRCLSELQEGTQLGFEFWLEKVNILKELKPYNIDYVLTKGDENWCVKLRIPKYPLIPVFDKKIIDNRIQFIKMSDDLAMKLVKESICSISIRTAREFLAALPIEKIGVELFFEEDATPLLKVIYEKDHFYSLDMNGNPYDLVNECICDDKEQE